MKNHVAMANQKHGFDAWCAKGNQNEDSLDVVQDFNI